MTRARKYTVYVLILVLPISAWAGPGAPCEQVSEPSVLPASAPLNPHANHSRHSPSHDNTSHGEADVSHGTMDHAGHQAGMNHNNQRQGNDDTSSECPCCDDDCAAMCVLSGGGVIAISASPVVFPNAASTLRLLLAEVFRRGPPPHVLYRPPILSV